MSTYDLIPDGEVYILFAKSGPRIDNLWEQDTMIVDNEYELIDWMLERGATVKVSPSGGHLFEDVSEDLLFEFKVRWS